MGKIAVVINTLNEEKNIERAIKSVKWADEIVVCDMYSEDRTVELAKRLGAKVFDHKRTGYVEPARNFAISKATRDWVLLLDADEEISTTLANKLQEISSSNDNISFVEVPRRNYIFGKPMKASMWWPDYKIRFFKNGSITWSDKIHSIPQTQGKGLQLPAEDDLAIIHYNYENLSQFLLRMINYSNIQAKELVGEGYKFDWKDLIRKPLGEFLGRFFASNGFADGLHGLALNLLQAFSFLVMYLRVWEMENFKPQEVDWNQLKAETQKGGKEINHWFKYSNLSKNPVKRFIQRVGNKIS